MDITSDVLVHARQSQDNNTSNTIQANEQNNTTCLEEQDSALLYDLANSILEECKDTAPLSHLDTGILLFREALDLRLPHPCHLDSQKNLAAALVTKFSLTNQRQHLDEAISILTEAMDGLSDDSAQRATEKFQLDKHPSVEYNVIFTEGPDDSDASGLSELAKTILADFDQSAQLSSLDTAIMLYKEALLDRHNPHPERAVPLLGLCAALYARFRRTGDMPNLDEAISLLRKALEACPQRDISRADILRHLSAALAIRFDKIGRLPDLDEAMARHRDACQLADNIEEEAGQLLDSAIDLFQRIEQSARITSSGRVTRQISDLEKVISLFHEVQVLLPEHHQNWLVASLNLATALCRRFEELGQREDLDECISLNRRGVQQQAAPHHIRCNVLSNLGTALMSRFNQSNHLEDLDEGISLLREMHMLLPAEGPIRSVSIYNLADAIYTRFKQSALRQDLDEAISLFREQHGHLSALPYPVQIGLLCKFAAALMTRFKQSGHHEDLDGAIAFYRELLGMPHSYRSIALDGLTNALSTRLTY